MKSYLEYYILREYKRQGKSKDYRELKKKLVDILNGQGWGGLSGKLLDEDKEFTASSMLEDTTGLSIEVQLDELISGNLIPAERETKFT